MKVLKFPLSKIAISFITGLIAAYYLPFHFLIVAGAAIVSLLITALTFFAAKKHKKNILFFTLSACITSFLTGCLTLLFHTESLQKSNYINCQKAFNVPQNITLLLREKLKSNEYNYRYVALVNKIGEKKYSGKVIVNIKKDNSPDLLVIGNKIYLKTTLLRNTSSKNPTQFDYNKYLRDKQIFAQIYTSKSEIWISKTIKKDIWYYASKLHSRIVNNLRKNHFNTEEMNVALALILGQRQEISSDIIQDYQFSGATHILSVSGLHVGFIMILINFILKPVPNNRKGSFLKLMITLVSLFIFAFLSGLSPSVIRSVVMFSILSIGNHLRRNGNVYHTLLVSMFLILLFEPYFLFDVGFQLSYCALFFILWLHPVLKNIISPKNKIIKSIWNVLTVSIAAQIGTLPLCLYYFHQFPGLFFVTNIIVIPILTFVMITGIIVMILAGLNLAPAFLITILEKSIFLLNKTIHFIASFDSFIIKDISFNNYYLFAFYLWIILGIIWIKKPSFTKLTAVLFSIIFLQFSFIMTKKEIENKNEIIVYNSKNKTIISERNGRNVTFFGDKNFLKEKLQINFLNTYLVENFCNLKKKTEIKNTYCFNDKKIYVVDSSTIHPKNIKPDILLLTQSPKINLERMLQKWHPEIIIADGSNSYSIQEYWKRTCMKLKIPFHATAEKGYYKLN